MRRTSATPFVLAAALLMAGCSGNPPPDETTSQAARGGQIWADTCTRCHNLRPPSQFAPEQWPVIVKHMRTTADLTRAEAEAVAAYLRQLSGAGSS